MIHGIYVKYKRNKDWKLCTIALSPEEANLSLAECLDKAKEEGHPEAEIGVKIFQTRNNIPEYLKTLKSDKILYN